MSNDSSTSSKFPDSNSGKTSSMPVRDIVGGVFNFGDGWSDLIDGLKKWRVWSQMGVQDIRMRYRRSFLGPFWISLSLIILILTLAFLYSTIFKQEFKEYLTFLSVSLLAWHFLAGMINEGASSLSANEGLMRAIPIPISALIARSVTANIIVFVHNAFAVLILLVLFGIEIHWSAIKSLLGIVAFVLIGFSLGMTLGPLSLRFRDVAQIITNMLQIIFFLTPIIWTPYQVSDRYMIVEANPFHHLIELIRAPVLGNDVEMLSWGVAGGMIFVLFFVAIFTVSIVRRKVFYWL